MVTSRASPIITSTPLLESVGLPVALPFPNDQRILGVGGLGYDAQHDVWSASSENLASVSSSGENNASSLEDNDISVSYENYVIMKTKCLLDSRVLTMLLNPK